MVHASGAKFWEITVLERSNHIRYGKLSNGEEDGVESGQTLYSSQTEATGRARELIEAKMARGYHLLTQAERKESPKDEQKGEFAKAVMRGKGGTYMDLCEEGVITYWKVQVTGTGQPGNQVRVEKGVAGGRPAVWVNTYVDEDEAARVGRTEVRDKLARGFKRTEEKLPPTSPLARRDVIEIDLSSPAPTPPLSPLRTPPQPSSSTDLFQVFSGTGLERYIPALEAESVLPTQVSIDELSLMTEADFLRLGIPPFQASKIKSYLNTQSTAASPPVAKRKRSPSTSPYPDSKKPKISPKGSPPSILPVDFLSPQIWDDSVNPKNWLITEAIDGVRCLWTGSELLSKSGQPFVPPLFFTEPLPRDVAIVGQLYIPAESSKKCLFHAKRPDMDGWKLIHFSCFDLPTLRKPLEDRIFQLQTIVQTVNLPFVTTPTYTVCGDTENLRAELARTSVFNPNGLLIRQPGSYYDAKRSKSLLKVKKPLESTAVVTGYEPGKGKYEGLVGGFRVKTEDGKEFKLISGLTDADRKFPPLIGAMVSFQYQECSSAGVPKFPVLKEGAGNSR